MSGVSLVAVVAGLAGGALLARPGAARPAALPPARPARGAGRMIELRGIRFGYDDGAPSSTAST